MALSNKTTLDFSSEERPLFKSPIITLVFFVEFFFFVFFFFYGDFGDNTMMAFSTTTAFCCASSRNDDGVFFSSSSSSSSMMMMIRRRRLESSSRKNPSTSFSKNPRATMERSEAGEGTGRGSAGAWGKAEGERVSAGGPAMLMWSIDRSLQSCRVTQCGQL